MPKYTPKLVAAGVASLALCQINPAMAWGRLTDCNKTAITMYQACQHDVQDELKTTLANCLNLADRSRVQSCRQEAKAASREAYETCQEQLQARNDACELLGEARYDHDPLQNPSIQFVDPDEVDAASANPYFSIVQGETRILHAGEDEIGVIYVTPEVREIQGVPCRVIVDIALEESVDEDDGSVEYIPVEVTDDWVAQDLEANVYYCGELARNFEDGVLRDLDGSFEAGREYAKAGLLLMANPLPGIAHRQEFSLGEAEDIIEYLDTAAFPDTENENYPCADAGGCLKTHDTTPLEPDASEYKYYIPGIGFILAEVLEDGELTGERETLTCVGDSLDVLSQESCGIADPEALLEALCQAAPATFCD